MADALKTADDYVQALGRSQTAYKTDYANRPDLQAGASSYADQLRASAKAAGVDLSAYGTKNQYGTDYTQYYKAQGGAAGAYDPTKSGQVLASGADKSTTTDTPVTKDSSSIGTTNTQGTNNAQNYIDQLNEARKQQAYADLGKSRDAALSNLSQEKSTISPNYYDQRNQAAAGSQQQARNFAEFMAARGSISSGANAQAEISNNMALQGNLGSLGRQENAAYDDIARRTTDVQNNYQSDVASTNAGIEADRVKALLNDYYVAQQRGDTQKQNDIQNALSQAGVTGQYTNPATGQTQQTIQAQGQQFNQNMANKTFDAQQAQTAWNQAFQNKQFDTQTAQQAWDNAFKDKSFNQSVNQFAQQLGLDYSKMSQSQQQFVADMAFKNKSLDMQNNPNSLDNQLKQTQLDKMKSDLGNLTPADSKELDGLYTGLSSGQLNAASAIEEVNSKMKFGIYTPQQGQTLLSAIDKYTKANPNAAAPQVTQQQIDASGGTNYQSMNHEQLSQLWQKDPSGKAAGTPELDWIAYMRDPRGKVSGTSFNDYTRAYGPRMQ